MEIVNGYRCANCTDTAYAERNIDPKHPKDGPFGIDAPKGSDDTHGPAVKLDGALAQRLGADGLRPARTTPGARLDVAA